MCGGGYPNWHTARHLTKLTNGETIISRTIRLLKENGVEDIAISSNYDCFNNLGVPILRHNNPYIQGKQSLWLDAFYPTDKPVCYIFGDVIFSPAAIKKIVETQTTDIEFFASAPPFAANYPKAHAEPFAFKVVNTKKFWEAVSTTRQLFLEHKIKRCIAWQLWQVIKGTVLNHIDYTNYKVINDYTCDIDEETELTELNARLKYYQFLMYE